LIGEPAQTGLLLPAVGAAGVVFTTTAVVPARLVHDPTVTVTLYVPAIAAVAPVRVGFCKDDVNDAGPVQLYVAPATVAVERLMVVPVHTGELDVGAGVAGVGFTVMVIALDVAGLPVTPARLEVMIQVTTCPLVNVVVV